MGERRRAVTEGTSLGTSSQMSWSSWVDGVAIYKNQAHEGRACQKSGGRSQFEIVLDIQDIQYRTEYMKSKCLMLLQHPSIFSYAKLSSGDRYSDSC